MILFAILEAGGGVRGRGDGGRSCALRSLPFRSFPLPLSLLPLSSPFSCSPLRFSKSNVRASSSGLRAPGSDSVAAKSDKGALSFGDIFLRGGDREGEWLVFLALRDLEGVEMLRLGVMPLLPREIVTVLGSSSSGSRSCGGERESEGEWPCFLD